MTSTANKPPSAFSILKAVVCYLSSCWPQFLRLLLFVIGFYFLTALVEHLVFPLGQEMTPVRALGSLFLQFLNVVVIVCFCVTVHRHILLEEDSTLRFRVLWGKAEWDYFIDGALFSVLAWICCIPLFAYGFAPIPRVFKALSTFLPEPMAFQISVSVLLLPAWYLLSRLALIFPAAAIGDSFGAKFWQSWKISGRAALQLPLSFLLIVGPIWVLGLLVASIHEMAVVPLELLEVSLLIIALSKWYEFFFNTQSQGAEK